MRTQRPLGGLQPATEGAFAFGASVQEFSIDLGPDVQRAIVTLTTVMNSEGYYANVIYRVSVLARELGFREVAIAITHAKFGGYAIAFKTWKLSSAHRIGWKFPRTVGVLGPAALEELLTIELTSARKMQEAIE